MSNDKNNNNNNNNNTNSKTNNMSKGMPLLSSLNAPMSQLNVDDQYRMIGAAAWKKYDACYGLKDYMQVTSNIRRYLRIINLEGSLKTSDVY